MANKWKKGDVVQIDTGRVGWHEFRGLPWKVVGTKFSHLVIEPMNFSAAWKYHSWYRVRGYDPQTLDPHYILPFTPKKKPRGTVQYRVIRKDGVTYDEFVKKAVVEEGPRAILNSLGMEGRFKNGGSVLSVPGLTLLRI